MPNYFRKCNERWWNIKIWVKIFSDSEKHIQFGWELTVRSVGIRGWLPLPAPAWQANAHEVANLDNLAKHV